jgi:hypothetical protein
MTHSNTDEYASPRLTKYGAVEDLTSGQAQGSQTDADFPVDTPRDQLTFS